MVFNSPKKILRQETKYKISENVFSVFSNAMKVPNVNQDHSTQYTTLGLQKSDWPQSGDYLN